jgi:hypothetical protein
VVHGTPRWLSQLPSDAVVIDGHDITPTASARNLGVFFDADLGMRRHVDVVVSSCFAALRQLCAVQQYVTVPVMQSLVTSLVSTRMDYCNSVLFGLPAVQLRRLQSVQNSSARLIFNLRRSAHISDALICLHWLRVAERIRFKMAVMTYRSLHGQTPSFLVDFVPLSSESSFSVDAPSPSSSNEIVYHQRSCISGRRRLSVERSAI